MSRGDIGQEGQEREGREVEDVDHVLLNSAASAALEVRDRKQTAGQRLRSRHRFHLSSPAAYVADC